MEFTGERPTLFDGMRASRIRYRETIPFLIGKKVLDFGCGVGHGTLLVSKYAESVTGFDISEQAVEEAGQVFSAPNLGFTHQFPDFSKYDICNMIEVLEHLEADAVNTLLEGISSAGCDLILTTPNGNLFPYNPKTLGERRGFHVWHYTYEQLGDLLQAHFKYTAITCGAWDPLLAGSVSGGVTGFVAYASSRSEWKDSFLSDPFCRNEANN